MAKHYGLKHQVAKQMYAKICDISALPPDVLQAQLRHTATANAIQAAAAAQLASLGHPVGVTPGAHVPAQTHHHEEDGDDLDDTFDDESFDENEALQRIAKMNEQQHQPHLPMQQHNPSQVHSVPVSFILFSLKSCFCNVLKTIAFYLNIEKALTKWVKFSLEFASESKTIV